MFFYAISIDPATDTPAAFKAFAEKYHAGPGWTFLTGHARDIERLSRKLGLYAAPDPDNKDGHVPALLIGNEATGQWIRAAALDNPTFTATMIADWVGGYRPAAAKKQRAAHAEPLAERWGDTRRDRLSEGQGARISTSVVGDGLQAVPRAAGPEGPALRRQF